MAIVIVGMAWEVCAALVVPTGSITVSTVLLWVDYVVPDCPGGLVVVSDALATVEDAVFGWGGTRHLRQLFLIPQLHTQHRPIISIF